MAVVRRHVFLLSLNWSRDALVAGSRGVLRDARAYPQKSDLRAQLTLVAPALPLVNLTGPHTL